MLLIMGRAIPLDLPELHCPARRHDTGIVTGYVYMLFHYSDERCDRHDVLLTAHKVTYFSHPSLSLSEWIRTQYLTEVGEVFHCFCHSRCTYCISTLPAGYLLLRRSQCLSRDSLSSAMQGRNLIRRWRPQLHSNVAAPEDISSIGLATAAGKRGYSYTVIHRVRTPLIRRQYGESIWASTTWAREMVEDPPMAVVLMIRLQRMTLILSEDEVIPH